MTNDPLPTVGVILSDTGFQRPPGDVGCAATYAGPTLFHVARGVTATQMVRPVADPALLAPYLEGALMLQERGADVITTTCGFLIALQKEIAPKLRVPFVASSLLQIPLVHALVRGRVAILTANDEALTRVHLNAAGVAADTPLAITGLQGYAPFADPLLRGIVPQMDIAAVETCVDEAVTGLMARYPDIRAFVCECHNLPPFSHTIRKQTGRPVYDILTLVVAALGNRGVGVLARH
jgi:hypothetical protein